ncbi:MAG: ParA family protein, partial [Clostridia bacterium]|nr:ParA family protein [Clostridia bacterium]
YIIIDCPPSLGIITINAFCTSDSVLVPIQCEFYALEGLSQLVNTIKVVKRHHNPALEIEGILMTMCDTRLMLTHQVMEEVKNSFPDKVFKTTIPRTVKLSEAPGFGKPVAYFARFNQGTWAYKGLAKEIIKNNERG